MKYQYIIHQQEKAYDGFFKINRYQVSFEKFAGGTIDQVIRESSAKGDIVGVLPYDPNKQVFLMVEQFRIGLLVRGLHPWNQEIVAGFMDIPGESPEETARRELKEETGCTAYQLYPLISYYPSPGGSGAKNHVFIAVINSEEALLHTGLTEEGEDICVRHITLNSMKEKLQQGEIDNATAIISLQQFFLENWQEKLV